MEEIIQNWEQIKEMLQHNFDIFANSYETFIKPMKVYDVKDNVITITLPDALSENSITFIKNKYDIWLKTCIEEITKKSYEINYILEKDKNLGVSSYYNVHQNNDVSQNVTQDDFDETFLTDNNDNNYPNTNLNEKYTFDTFVNGDNSKFAYSAAMAIAEKPGNEYNPLFIYGGPGLGKTHLMQSVGNYIVSTNPNARVIYITSEAFTNELISAIRQKNQDKFKEKYRNVDVLLIDDIQFISDKTQTQEEFFHTFNNLYGDNKQIVITSDRPPKEIEKLTDRLRTRFEMGLLADISSPKYETRVAILHKKAADAGCVISDDIIHYIANNLTSNVRELEGALIKVIALSKLNLDDEITLETAKDALKSIISPSNVLVITPQLILSEVSNHYNISTDDILSKKRNADIVNARHVTMFLCKSMTNCTMVHIGQFLGNRDHATVKHGCDKIENDIKNDKALYNSIDSIKRKLLPATNN